MAPSIPPIRGPSDPAEHVEFIVDKPKRKGRYRANGPPQAGLRLMHRNHLVLISSTNAGDIAFLLMVRTETARGDAQGP